MTDLPTGWVRLSVQDLAATEPRSITDGPFGSNLKTEHYRNAGPRVIRLQNIGEGRFNDARAHISEKHFALLRQHEAKAGDVLIAMLGEQLPRACVVPPIVGPAIVKADCARVRVNQRLAYGPFVAYALNAEPVRRRASKLIHGIGRPRLGLNLLRSVEVPLAPLGEQQRVVEAIESYFSRLDKTAALLDRVQRDLKRYRASVVKAAVEGQLVPSEAELALAEKRNYESASALLERILAERRRRWETEGKRGRYDEPLAPATRTLPRLPNGWCWAKANALFWAAGYGTSQKCEYDALGPPVLRIPNVQGGCLSFDDLKYGTVAADLQHDSAVRPGDFLFIRTNGSRSLIGRGALVRERLARDHHFASYLIRLRLVPIDSLPSWFAFAWHTPMVRDQLLADAVSSAGQHNVSLSAAADYVIPLPPAAEQVRILAAVEKADSIVKATEAVSADARARCSRLRPAILKWAFEGKLVDHDASDEPASVLLERIRRETAARASKEPRRRPRAPAVRTAARRRTARQPA